MVLTAASERPRSAGAEPWERVAWHDLECGGYRADMRFWGELARAAQDGGAPAPILDVGAGSGRVSLALALAGHEVCALDLDSALLGALEGRARKIQAQSGIAFALEAIEADARTFALERRDFALCIVPMQTIQLLGGPEQRGAFLRRAKAHLRPGGVLACAIVTEVDPFDCAAGDVGPTAETARVDGALFVSRAVRVRVRRRVICIERERRIIRPGSSPGGTTEQRERDVIELDRLSAVRLQREALAVGFSAGGVHSIAQTEEHVGSLAVALGA
jgi:SAM-dependent methyltransferase